MKRVDKFIAVLKRHGSLVKAMPELRELEPSLTEGAVRGVFRHAHLPPPGKFCRLVKLMAPKTSRIVIPSGMKLPSPQEERSETHAGDLPRCMFVDGDNHFPIQDPYVQAAKLKLAQDLKPDMWINLGDQYDCWLISRHDKEPERFFDGRARLQDEFDSARDYWREVRKVTRGSVRFLLGNHEQRLYRLIGANLGLFKLDAFEWETLAGLPSGIEVVKYGTQLRVGPVCIEHGDKIGGRFGVKHPAAWLIENKGNRNTIFGHTHRSEIKHRTVYDEHGRPHTYVAINQGHGSDVKKQTYQYEANWQHGFSVVFFWKEEGKPRFTAYPVVVINGCFSFGGRVYDGRKG